MKTHINPTLDSRRALTAALHRPYQKPPNLSTLLATTASWTSSSCSLLPSKSNSNTRLRPQARKMMIVGTAPSQSWLTRP